MPNWIYITLFCAFSLAISDAVTKRYFAEQKAGDILLVRFGLTGFILTPLWLIQPWPSPDTEFWLWVLALMPIDILAMWLYTLAIRDCPLSHTLPYLAFTPVFTILTGYIVLGETVTVKGFIGIIAIVAAAYLLNVNDARRSWKGLLLPFRVLWTEKGPKYMLLVAALFSLTSVLGKGAMQYVPSLFFGAFYFSFLGMITLVLFGFPRIQAKNDRLILPVIPVAIASFSMAAMIVSHFIALQQVEVAYMISVKRISLLFGIVLGALWFKEKGLSKSLLVSMVMIAGVVLIVL